MFSSDGQWPEGHGAGKAYHIKEIVNGRYYYPRDPGAFDWQCLIYSTHPAKMDRVKSRRYHVL